MATARAGSTAFKTHLSYFAIPGTSTITPTSSFKASLALGLNSVTSLLLALGLHLMYGNAGPLSTQISVPRVRIERTQLQRLRQADGGRSWSRSELLREVNKAGWIDWLHVLQFWNLAADERGQVSARDLTLFQRGEVLDEVARRRRRGRSNVLPFLRGGPISVHAHSLAAKKIFGVTVYEAKGRSE